MNFDRRRLVLSLGSMILPLRPHALRAETDRGRPLSLREAARWGWLYGLPLVEMARIRSFSQLGGEQARSVNRFRHVRRLQGPGERGITGPNTDTLYSIAWIDLAAGPVTISLPATGERYFSVQLIDAYTNTFATLGSRTTGGAGGDVTLVGPDAAGSSGVLRSATPWVWALGRILVDGADDLPAVHSLQDRLAINAPTPGRQPAAFARRDAVWSDYFTAVQALVVENPPPATDRALFTSISALGVGTTGGFDAERFSASERDEIVAGVTEARSHLGCNKRGRIVDGWLYPNVGIDGFGQDYAWRASVALSGIGALVPAEAIYLKPVDETGSDVFDGDGPWRVHLPDGGPPVDAFWSLTLYERTPEGQHFLTRNPIDRYSVGDRTPGLLRNADDSLDIWISRNDPGRARIANWLPAPVKGPFVLTLRSYLPKPALAEGRYPLPPIVPA